MREVSKMTEDILRIRGGKPLCGEITVQGAKNSALPLMAAALLCDGETVLHRVPQLSDVYAASRILNRLGCRCTAEGNTVSIRYSGSGSFEIPDADMRAMRSSIMFLGPILGRMRRCTLSMPGGCELGPRPIDLHLAAMRRMGVEIREEDGRIVCTAEKLRGTRIRLKLPSVGVTENVMMAAVCAEGETVLMNAAREPEIVDLARFLNQCGAKITGAGGSTVVISGGSPLTGTEYAVMPDRIAAVTYLCAGAAAGGSVSIAGVVPQHIESCTRVLEAAGCSITEKGGILTLERTGGLKAVPYIETMPYPEFPTDAQALISAVLCIAEGRSIIRETIFDSRFKHVGALREMGADIRVYGKKAEITGVPGLHGAAVAATDLRGGAAMAVAAFAAEGETDLRELHHLDRGYEHFAETFHSLGGDVRRCRFSAKERENQSLGA